MSQNTIYSVNKWFREVLEPIAPIAFHHDEPLVLPSYRVRWGVERSLSIKPKGVVRGEEFQLYCLAPRAEVNTSRRIASLALSKIKSWPEGTFFVPRYILGEEENGPIDFIAFRDLEVKETFLPGHPELSVQIIRGVALAIETT